MGWPCAGAPADTQLREAAGGPGTPGHHQRPAVQLGERPGPLRRIGAGTGAGLPHGYQLIGCRLRTQLASGHRWMCTDTHTHTWLWLASLLIIARGICTCCAVFHKIVRSRNLNNKMAIIILKIENSLVLVLVFCLFLILFVRANTAVYHRERAKYFIWKETQQDTQ